MTLMDEMVAEVKRREQLAGLERKWQVIEWQRAQVKRPFHRILRHFFQQLGWIHIHISVEIRKPCPEATAVS